MAHAIAGRNVRQNNVSVTDLDLAPDIGHWNAAADHRGDRLLIVQVHGEDTARHDMPPDQILQLGLILPQIIQASGRQIIEGLVGRQKTVIGPGPVKVLARPDCSTKLIKVLKDVLVRARSKMFCVAARISLSLFLSPSPSNPLQPAKAPINTKVAGSNIFRK